ncbi:MAG: DUF1648 domain-containing protein [Peptococcaceae bacterium]|nr:DUF1648 domain-containing protein [Peptococcaceae bacterium]
MKYSKKRASAVIEDWPDRLPLGGVEKFFLALSGLILLASLVRLAMLYPGLPAEIPTHFNSAGEIDGTGGKGSLIFLGAIDIICWLSIVAGGFFPAAINVPVFLLKRPAEEIVRGSRVVLYLTAIVVDVLFWYLFENTAMIAHGQAAGLNNIIVFGFVGAIFVLFAIYFYWLWRG